MNPAFFARKPGHTSWTWEDQSVTTNQTSRLGTPTISGTTGFSIGANDSYGLVLSNADTATWAIQELTGSVVAADGVMEAYLKTNFDPTSSPGVAFTGVNARVSNYTMAGFTGIAAIILIEGPSSGSRLTFYLLEYTAGAVTQTIGTANNMVYASPILPPATLCRIRLEMRGTAITAKLYNLAGTELLSLAMTSSLNTSTASIGVRSYINNGGSAGNGGTLYNQVNWTP